MKRNGKKVYGVLAAVTALLLIAAAFSGCGKTEDATSSDPQVSDHGPTDETTVPTDAQAADAYCDKADEIYDFLTGIRSKLIAAVKAEEKKTAGSKRTPADVYAALIANYKADTDKMDRLMEEIEPLYQAVSDESVFKEKADNVQTALRNMRTIVCAFKKSLSLYESDWRLGMLSLSGGLANLSAWINIASDE